MTPDIWTQSRKLIPRWRSLSATLRSGELAVPTRRTKPQEEGQEWLDRMGRFRLDPSLVSAAEAVEAALVEGKESDAVAPARRLIMLETRAMPLILRQAADLLVRTGHADEVPAALRVATARDAAHWRGVTRRNPRDPLAWVELALAQTVRSSREAARRSMTVALGLAPDNRHVLRSASRLFVHLDEFDHAHDLVVRSAATRTDPWLMAAEVALAEVAGRAPRFYKAGLKMVGDGGLNPHHISELAGAIGTTDLLSGSVKRSRKLFAKSMIDPTANSLAQGEWVSPHLGVEVVPPSRFESVFEAFEGKSFHLYREMEIARAVEECTGWADVDPYSVRPFEFGVAACGLLEDYDKALAFAQDGLKIRPDNIALQNGLAFTLASTNRTSEAASQLKAIRRAPGDEAQHMITLANTGLVAYRDGHLAEGRRLYHEAMDGFRRLGLPRMSTHARVYLAREATIAGEPDAEALLAEARKEAVAAKARDAQIVVALIERRASPESHSPTRDIPKDIVVSQPKVIRWSTPTMSGTFTRH